MELLQVLSNAVFDNIIRQLGHKSLFPTKEALLGHRAFLGEDLSDKQLYYFQFCLSKTSCIHVHMLGQ
jgi:hypothetical protein